MATYYLCEGGTAASKAAADGSGGLSTYMSITLHNTIYDFAPGDIIYISDYNGAVHGELVPNCSGNSSSQIRYVADGAAVIDAGRAVTGWTNYSGNIWQATLTTDPTQIWIDDNWGVEKAGTGSLTTEFDYYWASNVLYLYSPTDPDARYTEVSTATDDVPIWVFHQSYLTFENLELRHGKIHGLFIMDNNDGQMVGLRFINLHCHHNYSAGLTGNGSSGSEVVDLYAEGGEYDHNGEAGLQTGSYFQGFTYYRAIAHHNGYRNQAFSCGIKAVNSPELGQVSYGGLIEQCLSYSNGKDDAGNVVNADAAGFWLDTIGDNSGADPCTVRHNRSYDNTTVGFHCENTENSRWYGNVAYGNTVGFWCSCSLTAWPSTDNKFYNNTSYGNTIGMQCSGNWGVTGTETAVNNIFRNNISTGNSSRALKVLAGADNVHDANGWGSGNVYNSNCFGPESDDFLEWTLIAYDTYAGWLTASSQTDNNVEANPQFSNASAGEFWLEATSPCIDAGVNLGSTYDDGLFYLTAWPDGVITADQDEYGPGWEIGAYIYTLPVTYYVRADGTATKKKATGPVINTTKCMSLTTLNSAAFLPDDTVIISSLGGDYRWDGTAYLSSAMELTSSGIAGHPITYIGDGTPVVLGSYDLTGTGYKWTASGSGTNEYYCEAAAGGDPGLVEGDCIWMDGTRLEEGTALGSLADHEWKWGDNDTLGFDTYYIRDNSGDPDTSGVSLEGTQKGCIHAYGKSYIVVDGLTAKYGNGLSYDGGFRFDECDHATIQNCEAHHNRGHGISSKGTYGVVDSCTASYNGAHNIVCGGSANNNATYMEVKDCTSHHAYTMQFVPAPFDGYGIKFLWVSNSSIHNCEMYSNELQGIDLDGDGSSPGCLDNNLYENKIYDNGVSGIMIELRSTGNKVYRNLIYNNGTETSFGYDQIQIWHGCANTEIYHNVIYRSNNNAGTNPLIAIGDYENTLSSGIKIYNNVLDGGGYSNNAINLDSSYATATNLKIKNNILVNTLQVPISVYSGGPSNETGLESDYNCFDRSGGTIIMRGSYSSYTKATHCSTFTQDCNSVDSDPLFYNESSHQYWPKGTSPCVDAGVDLGDTYTFALKSTSTWPSGVTTLNQDDWGTGWEIGAYAYPPVFYLRADGSATKANAIGPETDSTKCMPVSAHDSATFNPNDTIVVSGLGGVFRTYYFRARSNGAAGRPITYLGSNSPELTAKLLATGWVNHSGNIWKVDPWWPGLDTGMSKLWVDGTLGTLKTSIGTLVADGDWWIDDADDVLYLYDSGGDPDGHTSPGIEVNGCDVVLEPSKDYNVYDGLKFTWATYANIRATGSVIPGSHVTIKNCTSQYSRSGIDLGGGSSGYSDWDIYDNDFSYHSVTGIAFNYRGTASRIYRNECHHIDQDSWHFTGETSTAGIKCYDDTDVLADVDIYENYCHDIGPGGAHYQGQGVGIWLDHIQTTTGHEVTIYHNRVQDCTGDGIFVEISSHCDVYGNLIVDCASNTGGDDDSEHCPSGIVIDTRETYHSDYNRVFNNTVYGGRTGIKVAGYYDHTGTLDHNEVRNNIAVGYTVQALMSKNGGDNTNTHGEGHGNIYDNNCFGVEQTDFLYWNWVRHDTYDAWLTASSQTDNNIEADPQFADVGTDKYYLASNSPCIDAGETLDEAFISGLAYWSSWPSAVETLGQNSYGTGWEIGAYIYGGDSMAIGDDFSVAVNGNIRHVSGSTTYTVLQLHRWLQDLADNAAGSGNDLLDITSSTPSERSTDNIITLNSPYNIDATAAEFLYDGSITQDGGDEMYSGLVVVGSLAGTTTLQIVQDNALYDTDSPFWGTDLNADETQNILMRCMVMTRTGGADIDGKRIRVYAREWGHTFAEFSVTMGLGNSVAAIFTNTDLNNQTAVGTVAGWTGITNTEGYQLIDLGNGNGNRAYYSQWNRDTYTINQLYERAKWLTRRGTASTIHGMDGELFRGITHQWNYDNEANGPFVEDVELTWGTGATAGTGILLALLDSGTTGTMWIQLLTGVPPVNNMQITGGSATCDVDGTVTSRSLPAVFIGQSTGSAIIGGFGIGIEAADLTTNDKLFDLTNTQQVPPNYVTFYVYGLISGEDRVLVTEDSGSVGINTDQMELATALTGAAETSVVVGAASIPADTPQTGTLRIVLDDGRHRAVAYTAHDGDDTFTIASTNFTDPNDAAIGADVYIAYIDKLAAATSESFTVIYSAPKTLFVRVRDGGGTPIKTFQTTASLGSGGGSATAVRTSDA